MPRAPAPVDAPVDASTGRAADCAAATALGATGGARRSQSERRATTRRALLDATVACLVERGFAGTTTPTICRRAGVSQGALFKHFPTKTVLLGAAAEQLYDRLTERFLGRAADLHEHDPRRRVERAVALLWEVFQGEEFAASVELELAARTDAALRAQLGPVLTAQAGRVRRHTAALFPDVAHDASFDRAIDLVLEVLVGMAVSHIADPDHEHYDLVLAHVTDLARPAFAPLDPTVRTP